MRDWPDPNTEAPMLEVPSFGLRHTFFPEAAVARGCCRLLSGVSVRPKHRPPPSFVILLGMPGYPGTLVHTNMARAACLVCRLARPSRPRPILTLLLSCLSLPTVSASGHADLRHFSLAALLRDTGAAPFPLSNPSNCDAGPTGS